MDMQRHIYRSVHNFVCSLRPLYPSSILTSHHRVNNADPKILVAPIAVIAIQKNYDCSITITQDQANQPVGTGWTVLLANPLNNTDVRPISPHLPYLLPSLLEIMLVRFTWFQLANYSPFQGRLLFAALWLTSYLPLFTFFFFHFACRDVNSSVGSRPWKFDRHLSEFVYLVLNSAGSLAYSPIWLGPFPPPSSLPRVSHFY